MMDIMALFLWLLWITGTASSVYTNDRRDGLRLLRHQRAHRNGYNMRSQSTPQYGARRARYSAHRNAMDRDERLKMEEFNALQGAINEMNEMNEMNDINDMNAMESQNDFDQYSDANSDGHFEGYFNGEFESEEEAEQSINAQNADKIENDAAAAGGGGGVSEFDKLFG